MAHKLASEVKANNRCPGCGRYHTSADIDGGRCTECGRALRPYGSDGATEFNVCTVVPKGQRNAGGLQWTVHLAESETQLRRAMEQAGYEVRDLIVNATYTKLFYLFPGGHNIEVRLQENGGVIVSDLKGDDAEEDGDYNLAVDGIEALILAHACAGVDVQDERYVQGVLTAIEAAANNL